MPLPFLAALGPMLAKGGALLGKGAGALGKGAGALSKFGAGHPRLSRSLLGALGGGLTQEFGGDEAYQAFLQQMIASQGGGNGKGVEDVAGTIIS